MFVDDVKLALEQGARAGAAAASTAGKDLRGDIENYVIPHLSDIAAHVAGIVEKRAAGIYTDTTAKALLDSQADSIKIVVETVVTLAVLEVQQIVNGIMAALTSVINSRLGFTLL